MTKKELEQLQIEQANRIANLENRIMTLEGIIARFNIAASGKLEPITDYIKTLEDTIYDKPQIRNTPIRCG